MQLLHNISNVNDLIIDAISQIDQKLPLNESVHLVDIIDNVGRKLLIQLSNIVGVQFNQSQTTTPTYFHLTYQHKSENELMLSIEKNTTDIQQTSINIKLTSELINDLIRFHSIDITKEISNAIVYEMVTSFISQEFQLSPTHIKELNHEDATLKLITLSNDIAKNTRRGTANIGVNLPTQFVKTFNVNNISILGLLEDYSSIMGYKGINDVDVGVGIIPKRINITFQDINNSIDITFEFYVSKLTNWEDYYETIRFEK